ncbi:MAG TPA: hypothetical protein PKY59_01860 [Pyrinomonadaceae bacterium]|nr:hypothetical protein [Pyrinomonadaceae bacterium]
MQQLSLNTQIQAKKKGFWARQFRPQVTLSQIFFDWIFGVILPLICFFCDPIVFKTTEYGGGILGSYRPLAYILSFSCIFTMSLWLICGEKLKSANVIFAGVFITGGIISFAVAIVLLPFSVIGLVFLIGILGFTPFFSSIVFLRNGLRALEMAKPYLSKTILANSFFLTVVLCSLIPYLINMEIWKIEAALESENAETIRQNGSKLKYVLPLVNLNFFEKIYRSKSPNQKDSEEIKALCEVYEQLTGERLEEKAERLID